LYVKATWHELQATEEI